MGKKKAKSKVPRYFITFEGDMYDEQSDSLKELKSIARGIQKENACCVTIYDREGKIISSDYDNHAGPCGWKVKEDKKTVAWVDDVVRKNCQA